VPPTEKMLESESQPVSRRAAFISWRRLAVGAGIVVMLIAGVLVALKYRRSDAERGTSALINAFSERRLIEPRLSGGFKSGEFNPSRDDSTGINMSELEKARMLIRDAVASGDSSAQLAYGRLLLSEGEKPPEALRYLRRAVAATPESAEAHNDLGVGLMQQEKVEDAIDEFEAALKYNAKTSESLFNRALCYQRLLLQGRALSDLDRVAGIERDKGWLAEIKRRVGEAPGLEQQKSSTDPVAEFDSEITGGQIEEAKKIVDTNSEDLRRHALWDLSVQELQAATDGKKAEAERSLFEIESIGNVLLETRGDSLVTDTARYLRHLSGSECRLELELTRSYVDTIRRFQLNNETSKTFERLEPQFRDRGNYAFQAFSAFEVADCRYAAKRFNESIAKLNETLLLVKRHGWPREQARILNLLAQVYSRLGQDSRSIKYAEQAILLCEKSPELEAKILQYVSAPYVGLGDLDTALARLRESTRLWLDNAQWPASITNLAYNFWQFENIYSSQGRDALALLYCKQALSYAELAKNIDYEVELSSYVAVDHSRLDQFDEAEAQLKRAFDGLDKLAAGRSRDYVEAKVLLNAGEVASRERDSARALECYGKAEALINLDEGNLLPMIEILRDRAKVYTASGEIAQAHSDLLRAVALIEKVRAMIETSDQRIQFLAASNSTFDQLISLDVSAPGLESEAFEMSEASRARALLEEVSAEAKELAHRSPSSFANDSKKDGRVNRLKLTAVQLQLPKDLTVVEYVVTERRTYLFAVTRSGFKILESPATTGLLDQLVHDYLSDLQNMAPVDEVGEKARVLYDYLIRPIEGEISGGNSLCIVPDKALNLLPFAALVDRSGAYLIESHRLTYAPSASVLVRCIDEDRAKLATGPERILAVGNPDLDPESFLNLRSIPEAEKEATESARFYAPGSVLLTREKATESSVLAAMRSCDVVHLAVHCLFEEESPGLAALLLAGAHQGPGLPVSSASVDTDKASEAAGRRQALSKISSQDPVSDPNDGLLFLRELYGIRLPGTKLVVLSACQSGLGRYYRGEGIVSLIRPFLSSGVPTVVASLWPVNSEATANLMIEFHRVRTLDHMQTAVALRAAQIEMIRSKLHQHPFYWAPFILVGAGN
jgi:CHAT domain-containing protein